MGAGAGAGSGEKKGAGAGAGLKESATSSVRRSLEAVWAMSCLPAGEGDGAMPAS